MGDGPAPTAQAVFEAPQTVEAPRCVFTAHNDGLADGIVVMGAGTTRWNGCYERVDKLRKKGMTSDFMYQHQEHSGSIYALRGIWMMADWEGNDAAYQAKSISSSTVPEQGWTEATGGGPAPTAQQVFEAPKAVEAPKCVFTARNDGFADGIVVTGAGTKRWNGCYERVANRRKKGMTSTFVYQHQENSGSVYALRGTWVIADWEGKYVAYQASGISSNTVPEQGWASGPDTPEGMGDGPAPTAKEVFADEKA